MIGCALVLVATLAPAVSQAAPDTSAELRDELQSAAARLDVIEARVETAVEDYNETVARLAAVEDDIAETSRQLANIRADVHDRQETTDGYVRGIYKTGPSLAVASFFAASDADSATNRATALRKLAEDQLATLEGLAVQRTNVETLADRLEEQQAKAAEARAEADARHAKVESMLESQRGEVERLRDEVRETEERERREAEQRRRAAAERERQAAERAAAATPEDAPAPETDSAPAPEPEPAPAPPAPAVSGGRGAAAVEAALSRLGKPYVWAAEGPNAFDCSGLTMWAWAQAGVSLPHSSRMQYTATRPVSRAELQPGDLVFRGSPIHHVSLYIGGGKVIDAPYSGQVVRIDSSMVNKPDVVGFGRP